MPTHSQLILPPKALASCIAGCIVRDTRTADLSAQDRVNYFPASPLFTVTLILTGQLHVSDRILGFEELCEQPSAPTRLFKPPQDKPQMSWSPGPILALTIAFFPDAWRRLGGTLDGVPPESLQTALSLLEAAPLERAWPRFWDGMSTIWRESVTNERMFDWAGSDRLKDWVHHLMGQLAQTRSGRGLRTSQRRLQTWTGHNKQTLDFFAKVEEVHRLIATEPTANAVDVATDAGFSDQSHMGRALKRATGFSPVSLNQKIATEESFWCYRLLGERF